MPTINKIPDRFKEGYNLLYNIEDHTFSDIIEGLSLTSYSASIKKVIENVATLKSVDSKIIEGIFVSAGSLLGLVEHGYSPNLIAEDVFDVLSTDKASFNWALQENKERFITRLISLLETKQIFYAAKSQALMYEYQNVLVGSRILTDVRPVFDTNIEETLKAAMVIHSLHLHYQKDEESDHADIYLALDLKDIKFLQDLLSRAEKKEIALRSVIDKAGLINLNE